MGMPGRPSGVQNAATIERRERVTARFHADAAAAEVRSSKSGVGGAISTTRSRTCAGRGLHWLTRER